MIKRYDSAGALFYLDPPYFGGEDDYGKGLFDLEELKLSYSVGASGSTEAREILVSNREETAWLI